MCTFLRLTPEWAPGHHVLLHALPERVRFLRMTKAKASAASPADLSATEMMERMGDGRLTSVEIIEACRDRAAAVEPQINALVYSFWDRALVEASAVDAARGRPKGKGKKGKTALGPLAGLPITIKESIATEGLPVTFGVENRLRSRPADADAVVVQLAREQGAIVVGKTNIPQMLIFNETDNGYWGRTNNPWSLSRTPGGSSGGEAAALATGISALGIGTDIGGSIRVPAAYCGITGLKPTVDRWSSLGVLGALPGQEAIRGQVGPMARTVQDLILLFESMTPQRQHELDCTIPPLGTGSLETKGLTIGWYDDDGYLAPSGAVGRGVREAASALEGAGFKVKRFVPPSAQALMDTYFAALSSDGAETLQRVLGSDPTMPQLQGLLRTAKLPKAIRQTLATILGLTGERRAASVVSSLGNKSVARFWEIIAQRTAIRRQAAAEWDRAGVDVVLCPPHATGPLLHGQSTEFSMGGNYAMRYNLLNFPAGTLPVTFIQDAETVRGVGSAAPAPTDRVERIAAAVDLNSGGLPVSVQVVARPWQESRVLAVMGALERVLAGGESVPVTPVPLPFSK